jgi:hypothetical protein
VWLFASSVHAAHWSFSPVVRPQVPEVRDAGRVRTPVDYFIQRVLERNDLSLGAEADRATLIRRVAFDLTGLPPTPDEIAAFLDDAAPDAFERMVERYLASPHYGERWGRHWLDVAGYADSNGYFHADTDRPLAYRYRDWVIRAVNADKPYDRFITEQIAGDELAGFAPGANVTPDVAELLIATHYLRNAPDGTDVSDGNDNERQTDRIRVLEGTLQVAASGLLGLTVQCARCHDHKFDPIRQVEYYRMQAVFSTAYTPDPKRWLKTAQRVVTMATHDEIEAHRKQNEPIDREIAAFRASLDGFAKPLRDRLIAERLEALDTPTREALVQARNVEEKQRTDEQKALIEKHEAIFNTEDDALAKRFDEFDTLRKSIDAKIKALEAKRPPPLPQISCLVEHHAEALPHHLLVRGVHTDRGEVVEPGVPAVLCTPGNRYQVPERPEGQVHAGRRSAFAQWLVSPENPLVARVMVNRIWQHHVGRGLVETPGNFGQSGLPPSHPELLDYLASEFVRRGWSVKAMHRLILRSRVYQQSSALHEAAYAIDPDNRLYWRFSPYRLDAESIRDAALSVAGELDRRFAGPYTPTGRGGDGRVTVDPAHDGARRRSVYLQQRRTQPLSFLELFDGSRMEPNCIRREVSTVALQSLTLLNDAFIHRRAAAFAQRVLNRAAPNDHDRLTLAFTLAASRPPDAAERAATRAFLRDQRKIYADRDDAELRVWTDGCQMILAGNAFLYVE